MKKTILCAIMLCVMMSLCFAQQFDNSPTALRDEALAKIKVGTDLMKKARDLVANSSTKENLVTASQLYAQAGQLFEQSENILKALGKEYVSQEDINNCAQAVQSCVDAMMNIKRIVESQNQQPSLPNR